MHIQYASEYANGLFGIRTQDISIKSRMHCHCANNPYGALSVNVERSQCFSILSWYASSFAEKHFCVSYI